MSNQLSAFCGWISGFMSMAASCWQGREMFLSPAFHSQHVLGRRGWRGAHSSVWGSRWHGCSCMGHWTDTTTHQQEVIKVQLSRKVSLVIGLCKSHQSSSTGTQNTDYMIQKFCQLLPLLCSQTQDEPYPTTEKVTQRSLIEALALRSPSFYSTIIKESANISVRF